MVLLGKLVVDAFDDLHGGASEAELLAKLLERLMPV